MKAASHRRESATTAIGEAEARERLTEEVADVMVVVDSLADTWMLRDIGTHCTEKKDRWEQRLKAKDTSQAALLAALKERRTSNGYKELLGKPEQFELHQQTGGD